ncbi:unnamed protein product [Clonostachys rosea f. rosea IK726]|uniref:Intradiol ring-cleavage dioxygenases domain-containing protein n=2 Tax=Bionectria ochroleuca TaxID=29856 RepID=A0A0B7K7Q6_BIOOC|nr:unnamed protein product [Clonostachys rosea f. rosea IK726]
MRLLSFGVVVLTGSVLAHPGQDPTKEALKRRDYINSVPIERRSLKHCARHWEESGLAARNHARRAALVQNERKKRALKKRALEDVLEKSHNKTELGYTPETDTETLFSGINSCVLTPEVTQGPYYVGGEDIRDNIVETQQGVDILLDYQVIDVDTCEPVPSAYLEMWHCNSTGIYSGVNADGNGDSSDLTNIDKTFLRGIQETSEEGVAGFTSIFPGHYTSRATHIHVLIHTNVTVLANDTLGNDIYASHVGQTFFDQNLIDEVEALAPYNTNQQELTLNEDDSILSEETRTDGVDPVFEYSLLGDSVGDGLFAWIAFGIDTTQSQAIKPATFRYQEGGVENPNSGPPGGGEGEGPGQSGTPLGIPSSTGTPSSISSSD